MAAGRGEETTSSSRSRQSLPLGALLLVGVFTVLGIAGSIYGGLRLAESRRAGWYERSLSEAVELSAAVDSTLLHLEVQLRALAVLFYSSERVEAEELLEAEERLVPEGLSVSLSGLAYARAVDDDEKTAYEKREGIELSYPGLPGVRSANAFTHFPVALPSGRHPIFRRGADLAAHPALRSMALSAMRLERAVVMSPAFRIRDDWLIGFAIGVPNGTEQGILLGVLPLETLLGHTVQWKSEGLVFRLMQDSSSWDAETGPVLIRGLAASAGEVAATHEFRFTHGEARWSLNWDVLPSYEGGVSMLPFWLLAMSGSLLSLLIGLGISLLLYQNALIRRRVDLRTAELEKALERAEEANRAKTNFLAVIGHELRTPLNAVIGFSELLEPQQTSSTSQDYIRFVQSGGRHLLRLVDALLEVAQAEDGGLILANEKVDLGAVVRDSVGLAGASIGVSAAEIDVDLPASLSRVRGDAARLELVMLNLVLNALRAAGESGKVRVRATVREDHGIRLLVSDDGPGMAESQVTASLRLFEQVEGPMNRRHEGLGIGLPLCRHLMRLHGGGLSIDTRPGCGTTVTVDLPADRTLGVA